MTPELKRHLAELQMQATTITALTTALENCVEHPARRDLVLCLISGIAEIARELDTGLDSTSLPKGHAP